MQKRIPLTMVCIFLILTPLLAKEKQRAWQTGKLVFAEEKEGGAVAMPINGAIVAGRIKSWLYTIETETTIYELHWKSAKPINLTVNGPVKFAIEKNNTAFLIDEDGKERKLGLLRKTARQASEGR